MTDKHDHPEYTDHERRLFAALPREASTRAGEEAAVLQALASVTGEPLGSIPRAMPSSVSWAVLSSVPQAMSSSVPAAMPSSVRRSRTSWWLLAAAGIALFLVGGAVGMRVGARTTERGSLEGMLARRDLSLAERILLMQRAGSAYVSAAQSYATAAKGVDSLAVQVASQVLVGAAQAVARSDLDGGLASRLSTVLQHNTSPRAMQPVIWY